MYKVEINNGIAILGFLCNGQAKRNPKWYPHPSAVKRAIKSYATKHPDHKFRVFKLLPHNVIQPFELTIE